jgi:hypothetical protein
VSQRCRTSRMADRPEDCPRHHRGVAHDARVGPRDEGGHASAFLPPDPGRTGRCDHTGPICAANPP